MKTTAFKNRAYIIHLIAFFFFCLHPSNPSLQLASAHGGKGHGDNEFTPLKAAEKAMGMFDELVARGRLEPDWETGLVKIEIHIRKRGDATEYEVSFHRREGEPGVLYIFFAMDGKYSGSNFSGK